MNYSGNALLPILPTELLGYIMFYVSVDYLPEKTEYLFDNSSWKLTADEKEAAKSYYDLKRLYESFLPPKPKPLKHMHDSSKGLPSRK